MKVLVCGDRHWGRTQKEIDVLNKILDDFHQHYVITMVIEGEAKGADTLARKWAEHNRIPVLGFHADWVHQGRAAGPIRNTKMLKEGKPDYVIAFHNNIHASKGTKNMVSQATSAGISCEIYGCDLEEEE